MAGEHIRPTVHESDTEEPRVPNVFGVSQVVHPPGESDTDSVEFHATHTPAGSDSGEEGEDDISGHSEPEEEEVVGTFDLPHEDIVPIGVDIARAAMARGFRSLDQITLDTEFRSRGCLMRVVPKIIRGVVRTAFRLSFQEAAEARAAWNSKHKRGSCPRSCHECC